MQAWSDEQVSIIVRITIEHNEGIRFTQDDQVFSIVVAGQAPAQKAARMRLCREEDASRTYCARQAPRSGSARPCSPDRHWVTPEWHRFTNATEKRTTSVTALAWVNRPCCNHINDGSSCRDSATFFRTTLQLQCVPRSTHSGYVDPSQRLPDTACMMWADLAC